MNHVIRMLHLLDLNLKHKYNYNNAKMLRVPQKSLTLLGL